MEEATIKWQSPGGQITVVTDNVLTALPTWPSASFDWTFADPPYFLSTHGSTCHGGARARVTKGSWDSGRSWLEVHAFNLAWLREALRVLTPTGSLWVSGTEHNIHSIGFALRQLGAKILNQVVWQKPNPPPNLGCRCFTHSYEMLLWATTGKVKHHFAYQEMRRRAGDRQMKDIWTMSAARKTERRHGKHPTQKPIALVERAMAATCPPRGVVLDLFAGTGTTSVVAQRRGSMCVAIDKRSDYNRITVARLKEGNPGW